MTLDQLNQILPWLISAVTVTVMWVADNKHLRTLLRSRDD